MNKRRRSGHEYVSLRENVSVVLQRKISLKCRDPGTFTIPCTIEKIVVTNCMIDLGASMNVLPNSLYLSLRLRSLKHACLTIQLADQSCYQPKGLIKDVLVQVGEC